MAFGLSCMESEFKEDGEDHIMITLKMSVRYLSLETGISEDEIMNIFKGKSPFNMIRTNVEQIYHTQEEE